MICFGRQNKRAPDLSSKLTDWNALAMCGGEDLIYRKRVLDLGPCYGLDAFLFAHKTKMLHEVPEKRGDVGRYVAVDNDPEVLAWMRARVPEAELVESSLLALPFAKESFDTILDFSSLDNTVDPWAGYGECARLLAHGGIIITTFANALIVKPSEGETPLLPAQVQRYFQYDLKFERRYEADWHRERAVVAMVKP